MIDIQKYSNPQTVFKKAKMIYGNDVMIDISNRKNKKYMILNPYTKKWIHFGNYGMEDYTKHKNIQRRENFRVRNKNWSLVQSTSRGLQEPYTAGFMSYFLLW